MATVALEAGTVLVQIVRPSTFVLLVHTCSHSQFYHYSWNLVISHHLPLPDVRPALAAFHSFIYCKALMMDDNSKYKPTLQIFTFES